jgi:hypothetical protein
LAPGANNVAQKITFRYARVSSGNFALFAAIRRGSSLLTTVNDLLLGELAYGSPRAPR